jgi:hypothetical protein
MDKAAYFRENGYAVFRGALPVATLAARARDTIEPYEGPLPRHDGTNRPRAEFRAEPLLDSTRYGLMDAHSWEIPAVEGFVSAFRDVLFSSAVFDALHALDGEMHYTLHQSIFFFESPLTLPHIEALSLDTNPRGGSFTVWAAVDPVTPRNGPPYVVRCPVGTYVEDAADLTHNGLCRATYDGILSRGETLSVLTLNSGDFAVWAPSTPHGSMPPELGHSGCSAERRSFQALYRPTRYLRWGSYPIIESEGEHSIAEEEIVIDERFSVLRKR